MPNDIKPAVVIQSGVYSREGKAGVGFTIFYRGRDASRADISYVEVSRPAEKSNPVGGPKKWPISFSLRLKGNETPLEFMDCATSPEEALFKAYTIARDSAETYSRGCLADVSNDFTVGTPKFKGLVQAISSKQS